MIYNSIYTIPSRLFFQILKDGNVSKLVTENEDTSSLDLKAIWSEIESDDLELSGNKESQKVLNISKKIEVIKSNQISTSLYVDYLRLMNDDDEVINYLKEKGFVFTGDLEKDLKRIERLNKDNQIKIAKLEKRLPKQEKNTKKTSFDKLVISYGAIINQTYKTNEITQSEFRALESTVKDKLEAIKKNQQANKTVSNGRKR